MRCRPITQQLCPAPNVGNSYIPRSDGGVATLPSRWLGLLLLASPVATHAQLIRGTVRDAGSREPLEGAFAAIIDTSGSVVAAASTDRLGHYTLQLHQPGVHAVVTTHIGYVREISNWFSAAATDTLAILSSLAPFVTQLSPVIVRAERDSLRALRAFGLSPVSLGGTIVTPAQVNEAAARSITVYDLVQSLHVPALQLKYVFAQSTWQNCVTFVRTGGCVLLVVDGVVHDRDSYTLDQVVTPGGVSYMFFLRPTEATTFYGTMATNGVLYIVTKGASK